MYLNVETYFFSQLFGKIGTGIIKQYFKVKLKYQVIKYKLIPMSITHPFPQHQLHNIEIESVRKETVQL